MKRKKLTFFIKLRSSQPENIEINIINIMS